MKEDNCKLVNYVQFGTEEYRDLTLPLEWINETCSDDPSRAVEKLKSHSYWRDFIKFKVSHSSNVETEKKNEINKVIDNITQDIVDQKHYSRFNKLVNLEKVEKARAKLVLNPSEASNVLKAVANWNQSDVKKELDDDMTKYYNDAMPRESLGNRDFTRFSHFVRFNLILSDKNRISSYKFRNVDFATRQRLWFPPGCDLSNLPEGFDPHKEPSPTRPPSAWVVQVPGITFSYELSEVTFYWFRLNFWLER